jgi:hypothetical protein
MAGSSLVSPTPSSPSQASAVVAASSSSAAWMTSGGGGSSFAYDHSNNNPDQPTQVFSLDASSSLTSWINAVGVDRMYRPPSGMDKPWKAIACLYVQRHDPPASPEPHRAVYLGQRTLKEFVRRVAEKFSLDPSRVARCVREVQLAPLAGGKKIEVVMDDDVVGQIPEAAAVDLSIEYVDEGAQQQQQQMQLPREWEMDLVLDDFAEHKAAAAEPDADGDGDGDGSRLGAKTLRPGDLVFHLSY